MVNKSWGEKKAWAYIYVVDLVVFFLKIFSIIAAILSAETCGLREIQLHLASSDFLMEMLAFFF